MRRWNISWRGVRSNIGLFLIIQVNFWTKVQKNKIRKNKFEGNYDFVRQNPTAGCLLMNPQSRNVQFSDIAPPRVLNFSFFFTGQIQSFVKYRKIKWVLLLQILGIRIFHQTYFVFFVPKSDWKFIKILKFKYFFPIGRTPTTFCWEFSYSFNIKLI